MWTLDKPTASLSAAILAVVWMVILFLLKGRDGDTQDGPVEGTRRVGAGPRPPAQPDRRFVGL